MAFVIEIDVHILTLADKAGTVNKVQRLHAQETPYYNHDTTMWTLHHPESSPWSLK